MEQGRNLGFANNGYLLQIEEGVEHVGELFDLEGAQILVVGLGGGA